MTNDEEYSQYIAAKESLKVTAKEVPLLFMWAMDMLQEMEQSLALAALIREQIAILEQHGLSRLDPDLYSANLESKIHTYFKNNNFMQKIINAVDAWPVEEETLITLIKERNFLHFDGGTIHSFKDIFHLCRQTRNYLAHEFFLDHAEDKTTSDGVARMEKQLENMLIDFHYVHHIATSVAAAFIDALNSYVKQLLDDRENSK
jgi:hypothetical protein